MTNLQSYRWLLVNSSAGKDSQAMLDLVCEQAKALGILDRVVVVHCDLGRVEWAGTKDLAQAQAAHYGVRFEVVTRPQGDLLDHVQVRGMWPSSTARYCTSDHKRGQVRTLITKLVGEVWRKDGPAVRVLNCLGMRADESPARSKLAPFGHDLKASNGKRYVDTWLPLHAWTTPQVWARIKASGVPHHRAYDLGMPRLSCCFCIFAPKAALVIAGKHNPKLLDQYVSVERLIGHKFTVRLSLAEVQATVQAGTETGPVQDWNM